MHILVTWPKLLSTDQGWFLMFWCDSLDRSIAGSIATQIPPRRVFPPPRFPTASPWHRSRSRGACIKPALSGTRRMVRPPPTSRPVPNAGLPPTPRVAASGACGCTSRRAVLALPADLPVERARHDLAVAAPGDKHCREDVAPMAGDERS